jgi:Flp pilus assembly pilin Flp
MKNFWMDESCQDLVEYALVVGLVALGATAGMNGVAGKIVELWNRLGTKLDGYLT